jgi:hypothetical protein
VRRGGVSAFLRARLVLLVVVMACGVGALLTAPRVGAVGRSGPTGSTSRSRARPRPTTERLFAEQTGAVLLLSDGIDGVTAIDVDHRVAGRRVIDGERAGDQEYRITATGHQLIVGWGQIYAFPLTRGPSRKIADATIYVPAAEPGQVWTITWEGGRIGAGTSTVQRITTHGKVVFSSTALDTTTAQPVLGVPDGLVVQTPEGPAIWNAATNTIGPSLGPGRPATSLASNGKSLAWCNNTCAELHVVPLRQTGRATAAHAGMQQLVLSNDNHQLAYLRPAVDDQSELVVRNLTTGSDTVIASGLAQYGSIAWSADSRQLFYSESSYGESSMHLGHYSSGTGRWEYHDIPVGDAVSGLVVLPRAHTHRFFSERLVNPAACPGAGMIYPSGRHGICSFQF